MIRHETERYRLEDDRHGFFTLTRKADNATAFFQGDDADLWERNMRSLEGEKVWPDGTSFDRSFNCLCDGYDCILDGGE